MLSTSHLFNIKRTTNRTAFTLICFDNNLNPEERLMNCKMYILTILFIVPTIVYGSLPLSC